MTETGRCPPLSHTAVVGEATLLLQGNKEPLMPGRVLLHTHAGITRVVSSRIKMVFYEESRASDGRPSRHKYSASGEGRTNSGNTRTPPPPEIA